MTKKLKAVVGCAWYPSVSDPKGKCVKACAVGKNIFNYGETSKKRIDFSFHPELKGNKHIHIITCDECCECGDW